MLTTVAIVLATNNLALGVLVGVLMSGVFFAWKVTRLFSVSSSLSDDGRERTYVVHGQVFFASADAFTTAFDVQLAAVPFPTTRPSAGDAKAMARTAAGTAI